MLMLSTVDLCPSPYHFTGRIKYTTDRYTIIIPSVIDYLLYNFAKDIYKNSTETYKREKRERTHTKKKNNKTKQKL